MPKQPIPVSSPNSRPNLLSRVGAVAAAFVLTRFIRGGAEAGTPASAPSGASRIRPSGTSSAGPSTGGEGRGRGAKSPTEIPAKGWWDILWRVYGEIGNDRILAVAAGTTFYALLALFPAVAAFVSLYGLFADPATINDQLNALGGFMPGGAIEIVRGQIERITSHGNSTLGFAFFSGLAVSLWSANAGMKALFDALNVAYDETEKRNFFWLNLRSLAFTLGAILLLAVAIGAVVVLPILLNYVGLGRVSEWLIRIGRWPALYAFVLGALAVLYRYGPSRDRARWRWITPGSILAGTGWIAFSMLFSWYISNFGTYDETYG
jgi:membrane protein